MKPLPPTNAELRAHYAPFRTWAGLSAMGLFITLVRNALFGIPLVPIRTGATLFILPTLAGALYAGSVWIWLAFRKVDGS